jgi:phage shock protein A
MVAPMSVMKRVSMLFRAKANKALDRMEDPRETLDYSYQTQLELLQKVRRGVADVATSRKRIELQMNQLQQSSDKLDRQARDALAVGREDLARDALTRKAGVQSQLSELNTQYTTLQGEEERLTGASQRLQAKVDAFRTKKETIKATYTAAEAQTRINEAFTGISEEMGDVGLAIQRAEDKTEQMKARAGAIDELMASGALDDMVGGPRDDIQAELDRMGAGHDVEAELSRLKGELGQGEAPRQIEGAANNAGGAAGDGQAAQVIPPAQPAQSAEQPQAGEGA